jgi:uncharacterized membrane protein
MKLSAEYRSIARDRLKNNWGTAVLVCVIVALISSGASMIPMCGWALSLLLAGQFIVGELICFIRLHRKQSVSLSNLFDGFTKNWINNFLTYLLQMVYTFLWTLLFVIPGIVKSYAYSMTMYLKSQKPELGHNEAIALSQKIMQGKKFKLFCLHLSFIGWAILSCFTLGIGFIFLLPYMQASSVAFYEDAYNEYRVANGEIIDTETEDNIQETETQIEE